MRISLWCVVLVLFCSGVSAEIGLSGDAVCTEDSCGQFCIDVGKNTLAWLYMMESSPGDPQTLTMDFDIIEFKLTEAPWYHSGTCEHDFAASNPVAIASHLTRPPSYLYDQDYLCDFRVVGYEIPIMIGSQGTGYRNLLHNGAYSLSVKARARTFAGEQLQCTTPDVSEDPLEFGRTVVLDNLVVSNTTVRVLVWDGHSEISIPYVLSDGISLGSTDVTLKIYPMGSGEVGSPIYTHQETLSPGGSSHSGQLSWDGAMESGTAPPGLYVYDIAVQHWQGGYFDTLYVNAWGVKTDQYGNPLYDQFGNPLWLWDPFLRVAENRTSRLLGNFHATQGVEEDQDVLVLDRDTRWDVSDAAAGHTALAVTVTAVEKLASPADTFRVTYSLNEQASVCKIVVYGPDLTVVGENNSAPISSGSSNQADVTLSSSSSGEYYFVVVADGNGRYNKAHMYKQAPERGIVIDVGAPGVDVEQAEDQTDPTAGSEIHFVATFSQRVADFATGDVTLSGTASATTAVVTQTDAVGKVYDIVVTGMTQPGTVVATVPAGVAHNAAQAPNTASSSTDNEVECDPTTVPPHVICIDGGTGDDGNDGKAWSRPMETIEAALAIAASSPTRKEVWVAAETYYVPLSGIFAIPTGAKLYGGFNGDELLRDERNPRDQETTLVGDQIMPVLYSANDSSSVSIVDGFTVTDGGTGAELQNSTITISNNKFVFNGNFGIYCIGGSPTISANSFDGHWGGMICCGSSSHIHDNVVTSSEGRAIGSENGDVSTISNNTLVDNSYGIILDDSTSAISNNIVAFNTYTGIHAQNGASPTLSHNCVHGNGTNYDGVQAGQYSTTADPLFVDKDNGDYHLDADSPCIEAGNDSKVQGDTDYDGHDRILYVYGIGGYGHDDAVDMGAYEWDGVKVLGPLATTTDLAPEITWACSWNSDSRQVRVENVADPNDNWDSGVVDCCQTEIQVGHWLTNGATYSVTVRSHDPRGWFESEPAQFTVAFTGSPIVSVMAEGSSTLTCTLSTTKLYAEWTIQDDTEIVESQYMIKDSQGSTIVDWTPVGTDMSVMSPVLNLQVGETYYFHVKARNIGGNWSASPGISNGVTVGCTSPIVADALRCRDDDIVTNQLTGLIVTAGTSQFNAGGVYHAYVQDDPNSVPYGYGLRIDFAGGTPESCDPGDVVTIRGKMQTGDDGERFMLIDLSQPSLYTFAKTGTGGTATPRDVYALRDLGGSDLVLCGISSPGVQRPLPSSTGSASYNKGYLVKPVDAVDHNYFVTYADDDNKFFYIDDGSFRSVSYPDGYATDGNGLIDGVCAEGTRVDWSWILDDLSGLEVDQAVRIQGISGSELVNGSIVRLLRLRSADDLDTTAPVITSPAIGDAVDSDQPTIEWTAPTHEFYQLCVSQQNIPYAYPQGQSGIVHSTADEGMCPVELTPGATYYAFVRVSNKQGVSTIGHDDPSWGNWSRKGHQFTYDPSVDRIILPVDGSTITDPNPSVVWKVNPNVDWDTFDVKITDDSDTTVWSVSDVEGNHANCSLTLSAATTYQAYVKKSSEMGWGLGHEFTIAAAGLVRPITRGTITYGYDDYGNMTSMTDPTGTTTYTYDARNRVIEVDAPSGKTVLYKRGASLDKSGYDLMGQRLQMVTQCSSPQFEHVTKYDYNSAAGLAQVTDHLGGETKYSYYDNGQAEQVIYPNNTTANYEYNDRRWLTSLVNLKPDGTTVIAGFTYEYNTGTVGKNGTRTAVVENILKTDGNRIQSRVDYTYDEMYRLSREYRTGDESYDKNYTYDPAGNRLSMYGSVPTVAYSYDDANKMLTAGSASFEYDLAGNLIAKTDGGVTTAYTWDWRNKLVRFQQGGIDEAYAYDGLGNRMSKNAVEFIFDGKEIAEEISGSNVTSYVGPGISSQIDGATRTTYHADGLGSTRATTDCACAVTSASVYDAYGNPSSAYPNTTRFGYAGRFRYYADAAGLDYLKARYYDPAVGRFISRDPIGYRGGTNLYAYAYNNPVNAVDPSGESFRDIWIGVIAPVLEIGIGILVPPTRLPLAIGHLGIAGYLLHACYRCLEDANDNVRWIRQHAEPDTAERILRAQCPHSQCNEICGDAAKQGGWAVNWILWKVCRPRAVPPWMR